MFPGCQYITGTGAWGLGTGEKIWPTDEECDCHLQSDCHVEPRTGGW